MKRIQANWVTLKMNVKGAPIVEFVGLRPKMYSFTVCEPTPYQINGCVIPKIKHKAVAKGITKANIARLKHEDYVRIFKQSGYTTELNRRIHSKLHQVCIF